MASTLCLPYLRQTSLLWWLMDDNGMFMDLVLATIGAIGWCFFKFWATFLFKNERNQETSPLKQSPVPWGWFSAEDFFCFCDVALWSNCWTLLVCNICNACGVGVLPRWFLPSYSHGTGCTGVKLVLRFLWGHMCGLTPEKIDENCRFWSGEVADPDWLWHLWEHDLFQLTNLLITDAQAATTRHHEDQQKRLNH